MPCQVSFFFIIPHVTANISCCYDSKNLGKTSVVQIGTIGPYLHTMDNIMVTYVEFQDRDVFIYKNNKWEEGKKRDFVCNDSSKWKQKAIFCSLKLLENLFILVKS